MAARPRANAWPSRRPAILLVKTSSLGDVVSNLPVIADIRRWRPDAAIDWVVEEAYVELVRLHPGVRDVIVVAQRRWRRDLLSPQCRTERRAFAERLRECIYDAVIDTQGLLKSAVIAWRACGEVVGYDWASAREPLATLAYDRRIAVPWHLHAIERNRRLAAFALGYTLDTRAEFGLRPGPSRPPFVRGAFWVALHGSSRDEKLWPEERWIALGRALVAKRLTVVLPWGDEQERMRSERLRRALPRAVVAPRRGLKAMAALLEAASFVVGVDTGLTHLAAALGVPVVALFSQSDPTSTGARGDGPHVDLGAPGRPPDVREVVSAIETVTSAREAYGSDPATALLAEGIR
jgi:heptosyltransferase-1